MTTHQLNGWEEDVDLYVFGILSHLEDYKLAYAINKYLGTGLISAQNPFCILSKKEERFFSHYQSERNPLAPSLNLISNQSIQNTKTVTSNTLFSDENLYQSYLLPRYKKWPYIIICEDESWFNNLSLLKTTRQVLFLHSINYSTLNKQEQAIIKEITYD